MGGGGIQPHEGLIQDEQPRTAEEGRDEGQLLPHPVGVAAHRGAQVAGELEGVPVLLDVRRALFRRDVVQVSDEVEVVDALHKLVQVRVIGQERGDTLGPHRVLFHIVAVDGDGPLGEVHHPRHCPEGGGLARPVVADEAVDFTRAHV